MVGDELVLHPLEVERLNASAARFRLDQHQWAQIGRPRASFFIRHLVQGIAAGDGIGQALLPVRFGFQHHRQLDHFFRLQFGSGHAVQHVAGRALQIRRGGQLHYPAGAQARQHIEGQFGAAVVRLIDDHERAAQTQHVGQRIGRGAIHALAIGQ